MFKTQRKIITVAFLSICTLLQAQKDKNCPKPEQISDSKYSPGQVWNYKTRSGEEDSTITILKVESLPKVGELIHIRIDGIRLKNCSGGPTPSTIQHAPFSKSAIDQSVTKLLRSDPQIPNFSAGYQDWLAHCGGVYTTPVAEMVKVDEITFNSGMKCSSGN